MQVNQYYSHMTVPNKAGKAHVVVEHYSAAEQRTIGVFTGAETVCVINSGVGMLGDLRKYVEDVIGTDKTIECVCLTGNPEDVGAAALFDSAYLNENQMETYEHAGCSDEIRFQKLAELACGNPETVMYGRKLFIDNKGVPFKKAGDAINRPQAAGANRFENAGEGYSFHLGGTVVEMAELPAQSEGQLVALSPTCCIAFVGDALDHITHLENLTREGMENYAVRLQGIVDYMLADTPLSEGMAKTPPAFYCSRSPLPMAIDVPNDIIAACREVLEGHTAHDAPAGGKDSYRMHCVNNNCIIYDAALIQ